MQAVVQFGDCAVGKIIVIDELFERSLIGNIEVCKFVVQCNVNRNGIFEPTISPVHCGNGQLNRNQRGCCCFINN